MKQTARRNHAFVAFFMLLTFFVAPVSSYAIDSCMTGSWHDPNYKHEGITLQVLDIDKVVLDFYTYTKNRKHQNWMLFVGEPDDLVAYDYLPNDDEPIEYEVGTGKLDILDNDTINFSYELVLNLDSGEAEMCTCQATYNFVRLTQPTKCEQN